MMITLQEIGQKDISSWISIFNNEIIPQYYSVLGNDIKDLVVSQETYEDISASILDGYKYYFIYSEQELIGTAYRKPKDKGIAYINGFYIRPMRQHTGYGTQAFKLLLETIQEYGYDTIYWETRKEYYRATAFYEKMGYKKLDTTDALKDHCLGKYYNRLADNTVLYSII